MAYMTELKKPDLMTGDDSPSVIEACKIIAEKLTEMGNKDGERHPLPLHRGFQFAFIQNETASDFFPAIIKALSAKFGQPELTGSYKEDAHFGFPSSAGDGWKGRLDVSVTARGLTVMGQDFQPKKA